MTRPKTLWAEWNWNPKAGVWEEAAQPKPAAAAGAAAPQGEPVAAAAGAAAPQGEPVAAGADVGGAADDIWWVATDGL